MKMSISFMSRDKWTVSYECFVMNGADSYHATMHTFDNITTMARMLGVTEIVINGDTFAPHTINATDMASAIQDSINLLGAKKRRRKYNPTIIVSFIPKY